MAIAKRIKVHGFVQGVSFRASMATVATAAGVTGWVRNLPDGTVEAFLEGDEKSVKKVVGWAKMGPPRARVTMVDQEDASPKDHKDFRIYG
ncbi:MAG: acylphosphatase [Nitrososphaerota archaeon]|nr:acylphosphatase [Nitrososphaerota archaeon]